MSEAGQTTLDRVRDAGLLERWHISLSDLGCDTCVVASATYSSSSATVLDRTTSLRALKRVISAHPALCAQLGGRHDKKPYFVRLPSIDLNDVLEYSTDVGKTVEEVVTAQLLKPFERSTTKPLWRVVVRSDNAVIFAWHHAIADGNCAHSFHAAFLSALNSEDKVDEENEITVVKAPEPFVMSPTIEERTSISVSFKTTCVVLYEIIAPASWQRLRKAWTGNPNVKVPHVQVEVRMRKIEPDTARTLLALCREHKCTITAFVHTLAVYVLSHQLTTSQGEAAGKKQRYKTLSTVVPISLRRFTGTSPLALCDQVTTYHAFPRLIRDTQHYPPSKDTFPWETAAKYGTKLHDNLAKSREVIGTAGFVFNHGLTNKYYKDRLGQKREASLVLSNIGVMPKLEAGEEKQRDDAAALPVWQVDNICFGQNDVVYGAAMKINMAGSPSGAMNISYTWGLGNIETEFGNTFVEDMHKAIAAIVAE